MFELTDRGNLALEWPHVEQYECLQLWQVHETLEAEFGEETRGEVEIGEFT